MCLIVDANAVAAVLDEKNADHVEFRPVNQWLFFGKGKFVYGGKKLRQELSKLARYRSVLVELQRKGKTVLLDDGPIDARQEKITDELKRRGIAEGDRRFNDAHLVAVVAVSGVRVVCTKDASSFRFLRDASFYDRSTDRPKLYTRSRNADLLCDQNIASCCRK